MKGFGDSNPGSGGNSRYMKDFVDMIDWPEGEYMDIRMVGPVFSVLNVWFPILTSKTKEKKNVGKMSLDFDGENDKIDNDICPYRKSGLGRESKTYYVNVIVRDLQEGKKFPAPKGEPSEKMGYEAFWGVKGDTKKTPVRVLQIPETVALKLKDMASLNRVKTKNGTKNYELGDDKYGCDLQIKKTKTKGAPIYDVQKSERTPLTEDEKDYLLYQMNLLKAVSVKTAQADMDQLAKVVISEDKKKSKTRDDSDDDEDEAPKKRNSSNKRKSEDEDDDVYDMDEDDEDEKPKKKRRPADDDDEDERPVKKSTRKSKDDDEDEDLDDDLEDEDEKPKKSRRSRDEDEDLDDDLDDDEKPKKKVATKHHSKDDDEDEDLDDDLEDEDEKPKKKPTTRRR